ncbi:hypothetical protein [Planomonospora sp. ID82291]|uniref:hypothetical protein n=1 Tax=Planomonospora sp. ID82291 TaxID=2738136 RepID=UPI0018C3778E|nr:hypothetical protein [Planomonospora sp. ID82291]MBG0819052.1 hypothetical protein [Planomonospora sp. ID82291]
MTTSPTAPGDPREIATQMLALARALSAALAEQPGEHHDAYPAVLATLSEVTAENAAATGIIEEAAAGIGAARLSGWWESAASSARDARLSLMSAAGELLTTSREAKSGQDKLAQAEP